jgi:D-ribose pyranase
VAQLYGKEDQMKKSGILNAQLAGYIAALGHKDLFLIGDAGLPIPAGVPIVDLAVCGGVPSFEQVLSAVLSEAEIEYYFLAEEIVEKNSRLLKFIKDSLPEIDHEMIPHVEFKEFSKNVKFAIRTGEFTPFPNIILRAGVAFPA